MDRGGSSNGSALDPGALPFGGGFVPKHQPRAFEKPFKPRRMGRRDYALAHQHAHLCSAKKPPSSVDGGQDLGRVFATTLMLSSTALAFSLENML